MRCLRESQIGATDPPWPTAPQQIGVREGTIGAAGLCSLMLHQPADPASSAPLALPPASLLHNASLFLDFDGTLVDLVAPARSWSVVDAGVSPALVAALCRPSIWTAGWRSISGRPAGRDRDGCSAYPMFAIGRQPRHGDSPWADGRRLVADEAPGAHASTSTRAFDRLAAFAAFAIPACSWSDKPLGVAHSTTAPRSCG